MNSYQSPSVRTVRPLHLLSAVTIIGLLSFGILQSKRSIEINTFVASTVPVQKKLIGISLPGNTETQPAAEPIEVALLVTTKENFSEETHPAIEYLSAPVEPAPVKKAIKGPPLKVEELIASLKDQAEQPDSSLTGILAQLQKTHPGRNADKVTNWAADMAKSRHGASFAIAKLFRERLDAGAAFHWYIKAAADTSAPEAFYQAGAACLFGRGTPTNYIKARQNLSAAAAGDHSAATYLLGITHLSGLGCEPDDVKAHRCFRKAVANGSRFAHGETARMTELGIGTPQNIVRAMGLYVQGAQMGDKYCMNRLVHFSTSKGRNEPLYEPVFGRYWQKLGESTKEAPEVTEARHLLPNKFL